MEDRVGFEPTHAFTRLLVFKTRLFNRLSIYPKELRVAMAATLYINEKILILKLSRAIITNAKNY